MRNLKAMAIAMLLALAPAAGILTTPALAAEPMDEERVRAIVEQLLRERPEIVVDALTAYRDRQERAEQERQQEALSAKKGEIFDKPGDPFIGDADAPITVVEFFDYRCGYCKRVLDTVVGVVADNRDVKVVFKEFPILGEASVLASRASLAVNLVAPEKYAEFHKRLMGSRGTYTEESLLQLADAMGIDVAAVKEAMNGATVTAMLQANYELAQQLGINGTPAFVVGGQVVPGAISRSALDKLIEDARG